MAELLQQLGAFFTPDFNEETVWTVVQDFGQGQVEAGRGLGARLHRYTKASAASLAAVNGNHKSVLTAPLIVFVAMAGRREYLVLDCNGMKFTTPRTEKGELRSGLGVFNYADAPALSPGPPKPQPLWMKELLPTMWSDDIAEEGSVISAGQPVRATVLMIRPAGRQILETSHLVIDDCAVANRRADYAVVFSTQQVDEILEPLFGNCRRVALAIRHQLEFQNDAAKASMAGAFDGV